MANKLDSAKFVPPRTMSSGGKKDVEIRYKAEQDGEVMLEYDRTAFEITPPNSIPVTASQGGFKRQQLTIKRRGTETMCTVTFVFFTFDADMVVVS